MQKHRAVEYSLVHVEDIVFKVYSSHKLCVKVLFFILFNKYYLKLLETATEEQKAGSGELGGWEMEAQLFKSLFFVSFSHFLSQALADSSITILHNQMHNLPIYCSSSIF